MELENHGPKAHTMGWKSFVEKLSENRQKQPPKKIKISGALHLNPQSHIANTILVPTNQNW